jgi:hypothetical protein
MNLDRKGEKESMREFLPFITASAFRGSDDYDSPNASVTNLHIPDLSPPMKAAHAFRLGKKIGCGPDVKRLICSRPLDGRHVCNLGNQQWSAAIFSPFDCYLDLLHKHSNPRRPLSTDHLRSISPYINTQQGR